MPFVGTKSAFGQAKTTACVAERFFQDTIPSSQFQPDFRPQAFSRLLLEFCVASDRADYRYQTLATNKKGPQTVITLLRTQGAGENVSYHGLLINNFYKCGF